MYWGSWESGKHCSIRIQDKRHFSKLNFHCEVVRTDLSEIIYKGK
jgi:hypothetical protein